VVSVEGETGQGCGWGSVRSLLTKVPREGGSSYGAERTLAQSEKLKGRQGY